MTITRRPGNLVRFSLSSRKIGLFGAEYMWHNIRVNQGDLLMYVKSVPKEESGLHENVDVFLHGDKMVQTIYWRTDDIFCDYKVGA